MHQLQRLWDPARRERISCSVLIFFEVHWRRFLDLAGDCRPIALQESCNKGYSGPRWEEYKIHEGASLSLNSTLLALSLWI